MIDIALKEWHIVWRLMLAGELALLLRKGGIHEDRGPGRFELTHPRFAMYPAWAHQKPEMLKPPYADRDDAQPIDEPDQVTLAGYGRAEHIWVVPDRPTFEQLDDLHPWAPAQLDMRFAYRPENPLYLVAVRAYRLPEPRTIENKLEYGGCRSWVPLDPPDHVDEAGAEPVLDDDAFEALTERIGRTFGQIS